MPDPDLLTRVETIERRVKEATAGPWDSRRSIVPSDGVYDYAVIRPDTQIVAETFGRSSTTIYHDAKANADLIANAPTDLAFLCAEVRRQQGIIAEIEEVCSRSESVIPEDSDDVVDRAIRTIVAAISRALSSAEAT